MTKVGLISDTHSFLHKDVAHYFSKCDEIWHAGDVGDIQVYDKLCSMAVCRGIYGNIDGDTVRAALPIYQLFRCEQLKILMIHIAGSPPKYNTSTRQLIKAHRPDILVCGHSHILKIVRVPLSYNLLHINPGAAGNKGFHKVCTLVRFSINGTKVSDMEVIELDKRGKQQVK